MTSSIQSAHRQSHPDVSGQGSMDPRTFRDALGHYASGVTIIAGHDGCEPFGFTCQSFYSVSVAPPLISFSVMANSSTYPRMRETGKFSVNVLAESQQAISDQFARRGTDKWAGVVWQMTPGKNPVIAGTLMWLDCEIVAEHEAGDHVIVIGQVNAMSRVIGTTVHRCCTSRENIGTCMPRTDRRNDADAAIKGDRGIRCGGTNLAGRTPSNPARIESETLT